MEKLINAKISVIGLGYVGLPLALAFGTKYPTFGIEKKQKRLKDIRAKIDKTQQATIEDFENAKKLRFDSELKNHDALHIFIVTVATTIDIYKKPNLEFLIEACKDIGKVLKVGDIVIFESTVYPGCTEDDCVPILEKYSGLAYNKDFFCGYSPERINPGDNNYTLTNILKITAGSTPEIANLVNKLYASIIKAGTYLAPSIKVAEAAKLIENCQRDVNISFVNELALIFDRMNIDTNEVLKAAGTKWNFLKFKPGLVGGHCIGVDPYYMLHKAEQLGYYPALIGSGRRINDNMGIFVANKAVKLMIAKGIDVSKSKALILGFTFKENCPDIRNTKVIDIYNELVDFGIPTEIYDPWLDIEDLKEEYGVSVLRDLVNRYDLVIHAVNHKEFEKLDIKSLSKYNCVLFDVKGTLDPTIVDARL
jgi:UDP-N-acetyl-D-glucosamine/UDP-N-acetyl-D-galactosamine dehydrogenase